MPEGMIGMLRVNVEKNLLMLAVVAAIVSAIGVLVTNSCETTTTIAYMNALLNNITILA